jgi:cellulose biosynthesis protein BcsQ
VPSDSDQPGTIVTFYSYKGGAGRSMALANVACLLGKRRGNPSQRVLVMDWDLEAPGLHRFFARGISPEQLNRPGVVDYFYAILGRLEGEPGISQAFASPEGWKALDEMIPLHDYIIPDVARNVDLMKAGRLSGDYAKLVVGMDWRELYQDHSSAIEALRDLLTSRYRWVLIDSRTGFTDAGGICTMLLPEKLVAVFTANRQSLEGVLELVSRAAEYRRKSKDFRQLGVFPLPSRIDLAEKALREQWRDSYRKAFEDCFRSLHGGIGPYRLLRQSTVAVHQLLCVR